jgi:uncharacterized protein (DUF4415 family)
MKPISSTATQEPSDDAPPLTQADLDRARFRVRGKEASREEWQEAVQAQLGKHRVSIMLDDAVIAYFKAKAGKRGYQTLINQALHQVMQGEQLEATLRRVIREELHSR